MKGKCVKVAYDHGVFYDGQATVLPITVKKYAGITDNCGYIQSIHTALTNFNDVDKLSFVQIADIIEKHYEEL